MPRDIFETRQFKNDLKKVAKSGRYKKQDLLDIIELLIHDEPLPQKCRDHVLKNNWALHRECHIKPDWLLIYQQEEDSSLLVLVRTGSHSELFE